MPDYPVWGFGNDDMHNITTDLGWHFNVFLMKANTRDNIKKAMVNGHFYIYNPKKQNESMNFFIKEVLVENSSIKLSVKGNYKKIEWIAYNTITERSEVFATGNKVDVSDYIYKTNYVRAKVISETGIIYTQPFGIKY